MKKTVLFILLVSVILLGCVETTTYVCPDGSEVTDKTQCAIQTPKTPVSTTNIEVSAVASSSIVPSSPTQEDPLITSCKSSYDDCVSITTQKFSARVSIIKTEKFEESASASDFYKTWSLIPVIPYPDPFKETGFPVVLFAVKFMGPGGQVPMVLICDKNGDLTGSSRMQLLCGSSTTPSIQPSPTSSVDDVRSVIGYSLCNDLEMQNATEEDRKHMDGAMIANISNNTGQTSLFLLSSQDYAQLINHYFGFEGNVTVLANFYNCKQDASAGKPLGYWECGISSPCKQFVNNESIIEGYKKAVGKLSYRQIENGTYVMISCEEGIQTYDAEDLCKNS